MLLSGKGGCRVNNAELGMEEWLGGESRGCCHHGVNKTLSYYQKLLLMCSLD